MTQVNQLQSPNFKSEEKLYLVRCFNCEPVRGRENYGPAVASGQCAWCGWKGEEKENDSNPSSS